MAQWNDRCTRFQGRSSADHEMAGWSWIIRGPIVTTGSSVLEDGGRGRAEGAVTREEVLRDAPSLASEMEQGPWIGGNGGLRPGRDKKMSVS